MLYILGSTVNQKPLQNPLKIAADKIFNSMRPLINHHPSEKAQLIDKLISSLDKPDKEIDALWAKEAWDRIDTYDQGKI